MSKKYQYPKVLLWKLIEHFDDKKDYFIDFARFRMNCEGWVKGEVLRFLSGQQEKNEIEYFEPEKLYNSKRCDVFFKANGEEYWMEIKTFPTNYCSYFTDYKSKPISNFRKKCKIDLEKLEHAEKNGGNPIFLLFAYPIPDITKPLPDSVAIKRWWSHLNQLKETDFKNILEASIWLSEDVECIMYVFMKGVQGHLLYPTKSTTKKG